MQFTDREYIKVLRELMENSHKPITMKLLADRFGLTQEQGTTLFHILQDRKLINNASSDDTYKHLLNYKGDRIRICNRGTNMLLNPTWEQDVDLELNDNHQSGEVQLETAGKSPIPADISSSDT